jgi:HAD superfamily phosphatase (TIGR01668 family)
MKLMPVRRYASVLNIPWDSLKTTHIIFDLDNTLLPWGLAEIPAEHMNLLAQLMSENYAIAILSNSRLIGRRQTLIEQLSNLDIDLIPDAKKPSASGFLKVLNDWKVPPSQCAMVGDQWLTDVLGANRLGMMSILVTPIDVRLEPWWARWRRHVERWLLDTFEKKNGAA